MMLVILKCIIQCYKIKHELVQLGLDGGKQRNRQDVPSPSILLNNHSICWLILEQRFKKLPISVTLLWLEGH